MDYYRTKNFELITLDVFKETDSSIYFLQPHRHIGCKKLLCYHNQWQKRITRDSFITPDKAEAIAWLENRRDGRIQQYNQGLRMVNELDISESTVHKVQLSRDEKLIAESYEIDENSKSNLMIKTKSSQVVGSFDKTRKVAVYLSIKKYTKTISKSTEQLVSGTWLIRTEHDREYLIHWLKARRYWLINLSWGYMNICCPECGEALFTDQDDEFCKNCPYSRAVRAKYTKKLVSKSEPKRI